MRTPSSVIAGMPVAARRVSDVAGPQKAKNTAVQSRNDQRRNRKASKKNPGESVLQNNGKTTGGYTPQKLLIRASNRRSS